MEELSMQTIDAAGLKVAKVLHDFVETALPGTGVTAEGFWTGLAATIAELAPVNATLLARRDELQQQIDAWHQAHPGKPIDQAAYQAFLTEIGYLLVRREWGKGYAGEAVSALLDQLFDGGARRVFADTDPDNDASIRLLQRLGFRREGVLRGEWETHIGVRDSVILGLLKDEWRAPVGAATGPAVSNALLAPLWATGFMLGLTGLGLALVPRVPRGIAVAVVVLGMLHALAAILLRRRASSSASTRA